MSHLEYDVKLNILCTHDRYQQAGSITSYFWQDLWGAKHVFQNNPDIHHYDIGSRIDGFISHLLVFNQNITLIDVRPLTVPVPGIHFIQADATSLSGILDESIESLSSLCAIEHFGLGRYGDTINPDGCFQAFESIQRVLKPNGYFYLSVPIGKERVMFNAHRVFYAQTVIDSFPEMDLVEFSVINKNGDNIEYNVEGHKYDHEPKSDYHSLRFGLFVFKKRVIQN